MISDHFKWQSRLRNPHGLHPHAHSPACDVGQRCLHSRVILYLSAVRLALCVSVCMCVCVRGYVCACMCACVCVCVGVQLC